MSIIPLIACAYPAPFLTMATILLMVFVSALHAIAICCCVFSSSSSSTGREKQALIHRYAAVKRCRIAATGAFTTSKKQD